MEYENKNALFGTTVKRAAAGSKISASKGNAGQILDYALRETGLEKLIQQNQKLSLGLSDPAEYLKKKNEDLEVIGGRLAETFQDEYIRLLETGITDEEAKKKATNYMNNRKEREMKIHNNNYPTTINEQITKKLLNTK